MSTVDGTNSVDQIRVATSGSDVRVTGLAAEVIVSRGEGLKDTLIVRAQAGDDTIDAGNLLATSMELTVDAGAGNDVVLGRREKQKAPST